MQFTLALLAAAATVVSAQGVTSVITPTASAPAGCSTNYAGNFEITVVLPSKTKRDAAIEKRATCGGSGVLVASLKGGVLTDALGRIGAIVANRQFQFDGPPAQTGSIYTGGWSVCGNGSLAIGGSAVFYQCLSGTFYNLYDRSTGAQCSPVEIDVIPCTAASATGATQVTDGQIQASSATSRVTQISDGQVQASSAATRVTQISDGQIQASSAVTRVTQISDGQIQASSAGPRVTQISDGQIQVSSAASRAPVSQFTDGQLQVTAMPTVTATRAPVTQISDGQIQVSSATSRLTTSTTTRAPVVQISDGQIQATASSNRTTSAVATSTRATFTGAAAPMMTMGAQLMAGAVAVAGLVML